MKLDKPALAALRDLTQARGWVELRTAIERELEFQTGILCNHPDHATLMRAQGRVGALKEILQLAQTAVDSTR